MKKRKWILLTVFVVILAAAAGAGIYFYPSLRTAKLLGERQGAADFSYELTVELHKEELESGQVKVLEILAELTGFSQEAMYCFDIRGSVREDKIHALIYPQGAAEPLIEFYLSSDMDMINEAMLYNVIRGHLLKDNAVLSFLVPVQEKNVYMSLEQVEQLFGIDLSRAKDFKLSSADRRTVFQYFVMLAAMSHEKQENGESFELAAEGIRIRYEISNEETPHLAAVQYYLEEPAKILDKGAELLSKAGLNLPEEGLRALKSISIRMVPGAGQEIVMPTEFVNQDIIDLISKIRELIISLGKTGGVQSTL